MNKIYIYVENTYKEDCIKYGIKLSEHANKIIKYNKREKRGIKGFLSPKDSDLYFDKNFTCLTIKNDKLNILIINDIEDSDSYNNNFIVDIKKYNLGNFENPIAFICSSILPENISEYNKEKDFPLLIENSKEFYYKKSISTMLESNMFSDLEIYQLLLLLGEKKNIFNVTNINNKLKIYENVITNKKYTRKINFQTD